MNVPLSKLFFQNVIEGTFFSSQTQLSIISRFLSVRFVEMISIWLSTCASSTDRVRIFTKEGNVAAGKPCLELSLTFGFASRIDTMKKFLALMDHCYA
jgi:hypothetical protein